MKLGSNSVDSALNFYTSNQSKLNYLRRDLNTFFTGKKSMSSPVDVKLSLSYSEISLKEE
jgi:hypothetical protein